MLRLIALCWLCLITQNAPAETFELRDPQSLEAIEALNAQRAARRLPPVLYSESLTRRCRDWAEHMERVHRMVHDRRVYGTDERECILENSGYIDPVGAINGWAHHPGHDDALFDRRGFPTAVYGGYAQVGSYACLRLCPFPHDPRVCN